MIDNEARAKVYGTEFQPSSSEALVDNHASHTWTGIVYPDHIIHLIKEAREMDREPHQLLNEYRADAPTLPIGHPKPVRPIVSGAELPSARILDMKAYLPKHEVRVQCGVSNSQEERLLAGTVPGHNLLCINALDIDCPAAREARKVVSKGCMSLFNWMHDRASEIEITEEDSMYLRMMNTGFTKTINDALKMTIRPTLSIDSFLMDFGDLIKMLNRDGFTHALRYFDRLILMEQLELEVQLPTSEGMLVPIGKTIVLRLDKIASKMGFAEIWNVPILMSGVTHPSLLKVMTMLSQAYNVPKITLSLPDDTFVCYIGIEATTSWTIRRA